MKTPQEAPAPRPDPTCPPRRGRLFWRIYRHGVVVLLCTVLLLGSIAWLFRAQSPWIRTPERIAASLEQELSGDRAHPARLAARLEHFAYLLHMDMAVYSRAGAPIASVGADPPAALPIDEAQALTGPIRVGFGPSHAAPLGPDAYLMTRWRGGDQHRLFPWAIAAILCLLALLSWPLARKIARPLERIAATARALGDGDLEARTGVTGRGEVAELAATIDEMATRLARLRTHERSLLANVSHELRTPLARIRVGLEWAEEDGILPPPLAGLGTDLAELESLVEDILAASRLDLEEGGFVLRPRTVSLEELVQTATDRFTRQHPTIPLTVRTTPGELACDPRLIGRVLINLLDNAARHGQGPIELEAHAADPAVPSDPHTARFAILDRGPGVQPADLPRLFDAFFRADHSRTRATGGTGLGLTLCKRIVEAHRGQLVASLREGGGMRFEFWIPG